MDRKDELVKLDEDRWNDVNNLVTRLSPEQVEESGLTEEGWSVKDLLWHFGCWSAEAARELERISMGTYVEREYDTDQLNAEFLEAGREMDLATVKTEWMAARNRALQQWAALDRITPEAEEWFGESGYQHYDEHLPDLRRWVERLLGS